MSAHADRAAADAPARFSLDGGGAGSSSGASVRDDDVLVHVLCAQHLSAAAHARPSCSVHVLLLCGGCAARTHNARVRADGAARWDAAVVLRGAAPTARAVTLCVVTGGRDPLLVGQTTLSVHHNRGSPPCTLTLHDWRTGHAAGALRVAVYAGSAVSQDAPVLAPVTLLRGSGDLEDDGHASLVSDAACTLRRLHVPLPCEPVHWRLTTRGLVLNVAASEHDQEARSQAAPGGGGGQGGGAAKGAAQEEAPRLLVSWDATSCLTPFGESGVSACKPAGQAGRDVVLRCAGGAQQRDKLLRLANTVRAAARGGDDAHDAPPAAPGAVVLRVLAVSPHAMRKTLPPRERLVAQCPAVGSHLYVGRLPVGGSVRVELQLGGGGGGGGTDIVTVTAAQLAACATPGAGGLARIGSAASPDGRVALRFVSTSRMSGTARRRLRLGASLCVLAAALAAATPGYPPQVMDTLVAVLVALAVCLTALAWQRRSYKPRALPPASPGGARTSTLARPQWPSAQVPGSGWTLQLLSVHISPSSASAHHPPPAADDDASSDAASDAGDDDDGPALGAVEFLPDGRVHPLWARYVYVWGDAGKEPPPASSLAVPGRLPDALARVKFRACLRWRREAHMDEVLTRPQPVFHLFKRLYPHAFHGHSRTGAVVFMEKARYVRSLALGLAAAGASPQQGAHHVVATLEFLACVLDPRPLPGGRAVRIVDASGVSFGDVASGEVLRLLRTCAVLLSPFFPERIEKLVIINAPPGFSLLFSLVSQFMSKRTQARVVVVDAGNDAKRRQTLHDLVEPSQLPVEYDGTCTCAGDGGCWRQHPLERQLWAAVEKTTPPELRKGV